MYILPEDVKVYRISAAVVVVLLCVGVVLAGSEGGRDDDISKYYGFSEIEIIKMDWGIRNLNVADLNGDGLNDIVVVNNRKSKIELLLQKFEIGEDVSVDALAGEDDINELGGDGRFSRQEILVTVEVFNLVTGDFNSDGLRDIAYMGKPAGLYVMLQECGGDIGGGDSIKWQKKKKIEIEKPLFSGSTLLSADLNGDGRDDLIQAGRDSNYIIYQKDDGQLAEPVTSANTALTLWIGVGDLNGDGIRDLVTITDNKDKPLHVRFGLTGGKLSPQMQFFIEKPRVIRLYDYDGIVGDEILTIEAVSGRVSGYKLSKKSGSDDAVVLVYPLEASSESKKRDLVTGDFDGDGIDDVVISEPGGAKLIFYKQHPRSGLGDSVEFPSLADITSLSAGDIDGDGIEEIGVFSLKEKTIGISKYSGERLSFPEPLDIRGEPLGMELADMDGTGFLDCAYLVKDSDDVRWFDVLYDISSEKTHGCENRLRLEKLVSDPDGMKVVDIDGDGLRDVIVFQRYEDPIVIRQSAAKIFEVITSASSRSGFVRRGKQYSTITGGSDGSDNAGLIIAQDNFARSLVFQDGASWKVIEQYNAKGNKDNILVPGAFDIDGDGNNEILLLDGDKGKLEVLVRSADKTYRFDRWFDVNKWRATSHLKMLFGKFTGGSEDSILLFDGLKFALVMLGKDSDPGMFGYEIGELFNYETKIRNGGYGRLEVGDINSDGGGDLVLVESKRNHIEILSLARSEVAKPIPAMRFRIYEEKGYQREMLSKASVEPREMRIADVTGDGAADLVTVIHDRVIIYPQDL